MCPRAHALQQEKPPHREPAHCNCRAAPFTTTREKPTQQQRPSTVKINKQIKLCIYKNKVREIIAYVYAKGHGSIKKSGAGKTGQLHVKKIKLEHFLTPHNKKVSKWNTLFWKFF